MEHYCVSLPLWLTGSYLIRQNWDFLQSQFSAYQLFIWGTFLGSALVLYGGGFFFWCVELLGKTFSPSFIKKYKIQPTISNTNTDNIQMLSLITFNHILTLMVLFGLFHFFPSFVRVSTQDIPTFGRFLLDILVCAVCYDILFFSIHRTLHFSPMLYQWIHKRHHQFTAPSSFSAIYAHPVEHLVGNVIPVLAGSVVMESHLSTTWCWLLLGLWLSTCDHSGFDLPGLSETKMHDLHHQKLNCNYGAPGMFMDKLFKTRREA